MAGLEPAASRSQSGRSNQLSYTQTITLVQRGCRVRLGRLKVMGSGSFVVARRDTRPRRRKEKLREDALAHPSTGGQLSTRACGAENGHLHLHQPLTETPRSGEPGRNCERWLIPIARLQRGRQPSGIASRASMSPLIVWTWPRARMRISGHTVGGDRALALRPAPHGAFSDGKGAGQRCPPVRPVDHFADCGEQLGRIVHRGASSGSGSCFRHACPARHRHGFAHQPLLP